MTRVVAPNNNFLLHTENLSTKYFQTAQNLQKISYLSNIFKPYESTGTKQECNTDTDQLITFSKLIDKNCDKKVRSGPAQPVENDVIEKKDKKN